MSHREWCRLEVKAADLSMNVGACDRGGGKPDVTRMQNFILDVRLCAAREEFQRNGEAYENRNAGPSDARCGHGVSVKGCKP
jgi:hypothetical protein